MTPGLPGPAASSALGAGYGQQEPPGPEGLAPPRSPASGGFGGRRGRQECLPAGRDRTRKGCSGKSQVRDLARRSGLRQVELVLTFLLSRSFGDFVWEKPLMKNIVRS